MYSQQDNRTEYKDTVFFFFFFFFFNFIGKFVQPFTLPVSLRNEFHFSEVYRNINYIESRAN